MAGGGGGGAWKVAYADFVTAMMALFMVLWISAQDKKILISTSKYFQNPFRSALEEKSGVMPFNRDSTTSSRSSEEDSGSEAAGSKEKLLKLAVLNSVAADIAKMFSLDQPTDKAPIDVQITSDGLRLSVFNRAQKPVFKGKTSELTDWGVFLMQSLAWVIDRHKFNVAIDGHTQAGLQLTAEYSAWELSADRANAARKALVFYAVYATRIERVSGLADTQPMPDTEADAEANQRVTVSLRIANKNGGVTSGAREKESPATAPVRPQTSEPPGPAARQDPSPAGVSRK